MMAFQFKISILILLFFTIIPQIASIYNRFFPEIRTDKMFPPNNTSIQKENSRKLVSAKSPPPTKKPAVRRNSGSGLIIMLCRQLERSRAGEAGDYLVEPDPFQRQRIRGKSDSGMGPAHSRWRFGSGKKSLRCFLHRWAYWQTGNFSGQ